jgi:hypothetical protein
MKWRYRLLGKRLPSLRKAGVGRRWLPSSTARAAPKIMNMNGVRSVERLSFLSSDTDTMWMPPRSRMKEEVWLRYLR